MPAINAMNANQQITKARAKTTEKLATALRINRAADDAAGLGISEKMRAQMREMTTVQQGIRDGISLSNVADVSLGSMGDMLQRINELCLQAANGTYEASDRQLIANEVSQMLRAVEGVIETADFNGRLLFKGEMVNVFTEVAIEMGDEVSWGKLDFLQDVQFDSAVPPAKASIELALKGINSVSDLENRTFSYQGVDYDGTPGDRINIVFMDSDNGTMPSNSYPNYYVNIKGYKATTPVERGVEQAFQAIKNQTSDFNATVSLSGTAPDSMVVKLEHPLRNYRDSLPDMGYAVDITNADGEYGNSATISITETTGTATVPEETAVPQIDGGSNAAYFDSDTCKTTSSFTFSPGTINPTLSGTNTMTVGSFKVHLADAGSLPADSGYDIYLPIKADGTTTGTDIAAALLAKGAITNGGKTVTFSGTAGNLQVTYQDPNKPNRVTINEQNTRTGTTATPTGATVTPPNSGAPEIKAEFALDIGTPANNTSFQVNIGGRSTTVYFYDSDLGTPNNIYVDKIDIKGKSQDDILNAVRGKIAANGGTTYENVRVEGGQIKFNWQTVGNRPAPSVSSYGVTPSFTNPTVFGGVYKELAYPEVSFDLDFSSYFTGTTLNVADLVGKGFYGDGKYYRFNLDANDPAALPTRRSTNDIDITGVTTIDDIKALMKARVGGNRVTVGDFSATGSPNKLKFSYANTSNIPFSDGLSKIDGTPGKPAFKSLFDDITVGTKKIFSGGTKLGTSSATIDFSMIKNAAHVAELNKKGFKVSCCTCPNEFINFVFLSSKNTALPENSMVNGVEVQNVPIYTEGITNGKELATAIADQASAMMDHFTGIRADGDKVIAFDRRMGDPWAIAGTLPAAVESGVTSDFILSTIVTQELQDQVVDIFVTSSAEERYISIELPTLSLEILSLDGEYDIDSNDDAMLLKTRAQVAMEQLVTHRATIGATSNQLESALKQITVAAENTIDAESRIRDADMAKETMILVTSNIISEASQAMMAQASMQPNSVMQLLGQ